MHDNKHRARKAFIKAQKKLDNFANAKDLQKAKDQFAEAWDLDHQFWRARGWEGYTIVRQFMEGVSGANLDDALELTQYAVDHDDADYDNWWGLAVAQLYNREFGDSRTSFRQARDLDRSSRDVDCTVAVPTSDLLKLHNRSVGTLVHLDMRPVGLEHHAGMTTSRQFDIVGITRTENCREDDENRHACANSRNLRFHVYLTFGFSCELFWRGPCA